MSNLTCAKSGVIFSCEHMPISLSSREIQHPLFGVAKKRLISLAGQWSTGKLSPTESYLLYLSLLDSTDLLVWRVPATYGPKTAAIIANNMESLISIIAKIDVISHPAFTLPKFAISSDTCDLTNSFHWIGSWIQSYNDWYEGLKDSNRKEQIKADIAHRETSLERLIKTASTQVEDLSIVLAGWAEVAGDFPSFQIPNPLSGKKIKISDYWKTLIRACANDDAIWRYPASDLKELIEHCEDNIVHGSIYAHSLMKLLRNGAAKQADYLGFGELELDGRKSTSFTLLDSESSAEDANKLVAISNASDIEPKLTNYPNRFAFLKAHANWEMKRRYNLNGGKL